MANAEHVELVRRGADAIREWRAEHPGVILDLIEADLTDANLHAADLTRANLRGAKLTEANLLGAYLFGANLLGANLRKANLRCAKLDDMYSDIQVSFDDVAEVILSHRDRLDMARWHGDNDWHNGAAYPVDQCGTSHCAAGWAHHLAALKRPELLDEKVNVYLVGRLVMGDEAAEHFFDDNDEFIEWLTLKVQNG